MTDYSQAQSQTTDQGLNRQVKEIKRKRNIIIFGFAMMLLLLLSGFVKYVPYLEKPTFCQNCHAMKQHFVSWQDSGHNKTSCFSCHFGQVKKPQIPPLKVAEKQYWNIVLRDETYNVSSTMNRVKVYVAEVNRTIDTIKNEWNYNLEFAGKFGQLVTMFLGGRQDGVEKTWRNCDACHSDVSAKNSKYDSTGHNKHLSIGLTCQQCHGNVAHDTPVKLKRGDCAKCHNQGIPKPKSHKTSVFIMNHGKTFLQKYSCKICHVQGAKEKVCMDCHGVEMPHKPVYVSVHIQQLKVIGLKRCQNCHYDEPKHKTGSYSSGLAIKKKKEVTCVNCHGNKLFHNRTTALKTHGQRVINEGTSACYTCHKTAECTDCHGGVQMPHPGGFIQQHTAAAKKGDMANCVKCHDINVGRAPFCISCHMMEMPHPEGFLNQHESSSDPGCDYCHSPANPIANSAGLAIAEARYSDSYCRDCH